MTSVEEIELLKEEVMSSPVLLRIWAEFVSNDYIGAAHLGPQFEGNFGDRLVLAFRRFAVVRYATFSEAFLVTTIAKPQPLTCVAINKQATKSCKTS